VPGPVFFGARNLCQSAELSVPYGVGFVDKAGLPKTLPPGVGLARKPMGST